MSKYVDNITWDDCAHMKPPFVSEEERASALAKLEDHEAEAREKGIPSIGAGAIYPVREQDILCDPFPIPKWYGQGYGLDVGWRATAACFIAHNPEKDIFYVTGEYKSSKQTPIVHAYSIKAMMPFPLEGAIDPASKGSSQRDGKKLFDEYIDLGLELALATNIVRAGIHRCLRLMQSGRLKVFSTCQDWLKEKRLYRRDENGNIVKENDHLMDAMRYGIYTTGIYRQSPEETDPNEERYGEF